MGYKVGTELIWHYTHQWRVLAQFDETWCPVKGWELLEELFNVK